MLKQSVHLWNENWNSLNRDLSKADLQGRDLTAANFQDTNLACSNLEGCDLSKAHLERADLSGAAFGAADNGANLCQAELGEANLSGCDLSGVKGGLQQQQLAGADLTGATLPAPLTKLFDSLDAVEDISESARKLFMAMLVGCLYSWLTIATTTDVNLVTNRASSPLPIIQTSIAIVGFYVVAPLLLLCVYLYFHFYLQKLWEELGSLPAIFPDGRRLHQRTDPWLLNDLVRSHVLLLRADRPFLSYFQQAISIVLAWWSVPATLVLFWERYLPRHDDSWFGTKLHAVLLAVSITAAILLYSLAAATLRGYVRRPFSWMDTIKSPRVYCALALLFALSAASLVGSREIINGARPEPPLRFMNDTHGHIYLVRPYGWLPRALGRVLYSSIANLAQADVSVKPPNWMGKRKSELDLVKGAQLSGVDLRFANARGAFLARAVLSGAHLDGADLSTSDLRSADLEWAYLAGAHLELADLEGADLTGAELTRTHMRDANFRGATLSFAKLKDAELVRTDLSGATLNGADLTHADLSGAVLSGADLTSRPLMVSELLFSGLGGSADSDANLTSANVEFADFRSGRHGQVTRIALDALKSAQHWDKAYYDPYVLKELGLPPDHNRELDKEAERETRNRIVVFPDGKGTTLRLEMNLHQGRLGDPK
jgi:uncharacterized protein YjbI with pentapeptide repeats